AVVIGLVVVGLVVVRLVVVRSRLVTGVLVVVLVVARLVELVFETGDVRGLAGPGLMVAHSASLTRSGKGLDEASIGRPEILVREDRATGHDQPRARVVRRAHVVVIDPAVDLDVHVLRQRRAQT